MKKIEILANALEFPADAFEVVNIYEGIGRMKKIEDFRIERPIAEDGAETLLDTDAYFDMSVYPITGLVNVTVGAMSESEHEAPLTTFVLEPADLLALRNWLEKNYRRIHGLHGRFVASQAKAAGNEP